MRRSKSSGDWLDLGRLWEWGREHPGVVMMGAFLLAALLLRSPQAKQGSPPDVDADETPLFI